MESDLSLKQKNITNINKLKIFFSYSTNDKRIVGILKKSLEPYEFEVYAAHDYDGINPATEWKDEIIDAIIKCDVFIPLITNNFKDSEWTDQEAGMAKINDKFIIPLEVDTPPYGFIGNIQSLKLNRNKLTSETYMEYELPHKIYSVIKRKFKEDIFINELTEIFSFDEANEKVKKIEHCKNITPKHVNQIYQITKENRKIHEAYEARKVLISFFSKHKEYLEEEKYKEIITVLR